MTRLGQNKPSLKKTAPAKPGAKTASLVLADGQLKEEVLLFVGVELFQKGPCRP